MKNVAFKLIGSLFLTVHGRSTPTDAEFRAFLALFKSAPLDKLRVLSYTLGGAPTAAQRHQVNEALGGRQVPVAIVTDTRMVRGIITAMSWFNKNHRAFAPDDMESAFEHLSVPPERFAHFTAELKALEAELARDETAPSSRAAATLRGR